MRWISLTKYVGALAMFAAVTVHAQTPPAPPPSDPPAAAVGASVNLSIPQMVEGVATLEIQIADDARKMFQLRDVARKDKDVVKLTCVNDRLVELKAQQNIYDQEKQQFSASTSASNTAGAAPSYGVLRSTAEEIKKLRGATEACIGVPELYKQESDVDVSHPDFPDDPTTTDPFEPTFEDVEPPGYASPFA
ncbi:MAG: hypothetical protein H0T42_16825 [Deltaproteobacteria bacterium]|nr:hypothetical protein [Deltaproteobacteria bacterium]